MNGGWLPRRVFDVQTYDNINAIYAEGRLAFKRVKGEPANAKPQDCRLLERERTIVWEKVAENAMKR